MSMNKFIKMTPENFKKIFDNWADEKLKSCQIGNGIAVINPMYISLSDILIYAWQKNIVVEIKDWQSNLKTVKFHSKLEEI